MPETEEEFRKKAEFDITLEKNFQAWWQLYSALQFAVRCLSNAAFHSLEKIAAVEDIRSFADISSPVYKIYFQIWCI